MEITRMNMGTWGKIRAFFDLMTKDGFTMKGFKIVEGTNGLFVGFPSEKDKDGEYQETIWAEKELKNQVREMAIEQYKEATGPYPDEQYEELVQQDLVQEEPPTGDEDIPF